MTLIKVIVLVAVGAVVAVLGYNNLMYWKGEVYADATGDWLSGVRVTLVRDRAIVATAVTGADGEFDLRAGFTHNPEDRIVLCKAGYQSLVVDRRPKRSTARAGTGRPMLRGRYGLIATSPAFVPPEATPRDSALVMLACR